MERLEESPGQESGGMGEHTAGTLENITFKCEHLGIYVLYRYRHVWVSANHERWEKEKSRMNKRRVRESRNESRKYRETRVVSVSGK